MALIMIADDDVVLTTLLKDFLQSRAHQVMVVNDGIAASMKAQDWRPQLIVMDILMPGVYGTSAYKTLESAGIAKTTPFIFITSVPLEHARAIVPRTPRTRLLPKPLDFTKLEAAVAELLAPPAS